jgi:hypothetical protein
MLRSVNDLRGYTVHAREGDTGEVHEFYCDDLIWTIRYLVVERGNWLMGRRVLVSPAALGQPNWEAQVLPVGLTRKQVENSSPIDEEKPVSRPR